METIDIKLIVTDVDGTLTDSGIYYDCNGNELKKFRNSIWYCQELVPATWRRRARTNIRAEFPSENATTTRGRRGISLFNRSSTLLVWIRIQCS